MTYSYALVCSVLILCVEVLSDSSMLAEDPVRSDELFGRAAACLGE